MLDQLLTDALSHIDRYGKTDPHIAAAATEDCCIHANHFTIQINQRATRVTGIDGSVGLDEVFIIVQPDTATTLGTDDTGRQSMRQAKGIAEGRTQSPTSS